MPFLGMSGMSIERDSVYPAPVLGRLSVSPAAAYSLRRLSASATKAIQVRRSSDNTTLDIGFVGSNFDVASLLAFVGAGNGFVTTWYDQVGSVNATQATALSQPRIVNGGTIVVDSGMPAIEFLGTQDFSFTFSHSGTLSLGCVGRSTFAGSSGFLQIGLTNTLGSLFIETTFVKARGLAVPIPTGDATIAYTANEKIQTSATYQTGNIRIWKNGVIGTSSTGTLNSAVSQSSTLGSLGGGIYNFVGTIQEIVLFNSILSASDRQTLERNQGAYYAISVA